jgi:hypothetical protein
MMTVTAVQVRRDAAARLIALAGDEPYDPTRLRAVSFDILRNRALRRALASGDRLEVERVRLEVDTLLPVAKGDATALYDAMAAGGVAALLGDTPMPVPTLDELETTLAAIGGGQ